MTRVHDIEIYKTTSEERGFKHLYYHVNYCGPDMLNPEVDSYCSNFTIRASYSDYGDSKKKSYFNIEKQFPHSPEKHEYSIYTTLEKAEKRMHSICKQVAKLYWKKSVPNELKEFVNIVDKTIKP
jgi:hypothetical protein